MPFDQFRTVVAALDRLTTQVGRVADTMPTPVEDYDDDGPTTDDDALRQQLAAALEAADYRPDMRRGDLADALMPIVRPLAAELARIRRALDPDDETYIRETVDDQFALQAKVDEITSILRRVRTLHRRETVQTTGGPADVCVSCESDAMDYPWPCPTIEALSGPDEPDAPDDDLTTMDDDDLHAHTHAALTAALTTEHYRRARERIEASPEEHCAAFADVVMPLFQGLLQGQAAPPTCDATSSTGMTVVGPCALRYQHDGPMHQDQRGGTWTVAVDPAEQPATDRGGCCDCPHEMEV